VTIDARTGRTIERVYVHAKVGIVDDRWLTIGSANLNAHSFFNDTEVNVVACDPELARATRLRLWSEHLERPVEEVSGHPCEVVDRLWWPIAAGEHDRRRDGAARAHRLRLLSPGSRRIERLLGPLDAVVVDG
jgi:phosphatidylserine/phosphatidylglycerophosphate/cardiolipin synthase-like enzyme